MSQTAIAPTKDDYKLINNGKNLYFTILAISPFSSVASDLNTLGTTFYLIITKEFVKTNPDWIHCTHCLLIFSEVIFKY